MKKLLLSLLIFAGLCSCSSNEDYDNVPEPIISFITQYWPNPVIDSYSHPSSNVYDVNIKDGPSLEFGGDYSWTEIDGNGMPLPETLLFNELPETLYDYLEGGEYLNQVMEMERNNRYYYLDLLNFNLTYDISTQTIRQSTD